MAETLNQYLDENQERFVEQLKQWLAIPSISTLVENTEDVYDAAEWVRNKLVFMGFSEVRTIPTNAHPLVYCEWRTDPQQPTLLIYGHYDVQPVDPVYEWTSPPFEPEVRDGDLYARGASDDKGQVMLVLAALEAWLKVEGDLPVNVKILLEGEEEAGGSGVDRFVTRNSGLLKADAALICDTSMFSAEQPSIINGLRGILYTEIEVFGPERDLHSGSYGGVAPNPIHALCLLISRLKGEDGVINIPELCDRIQETGPEEREFLKNDPLNMESALLAEMGVEQLVGDKNYSPLERLGICPTLEVHGISGGFVGDGAKTVIPAKALAKVSLRLPATLDPNEVFGWLDKVIQEHMPAGYTVQATNLHGGRGLSVDPDNTFVRAAADSLKSVYGKEPVFMREGGSIPIAALFDSVLKVPVVLMGFGLPDDNIHAPNEKINLEQFRSGMKTVADFLGRIKQ